VDCGCPRGSHLDVSVREHGVFLCVAREKTMKREKPWYETQYTYVWVFNTGRGLCVCIRLPQNIGIVYDLGCSEDFSTADFIAEQIAPKLDKQKDYGRPIAQLVLSHPHADHIREVTKLAADGEEECVLNPCLLTCPNDRDDPGNSAEKVDFNRVNNSKGTEEIIQSYRSLYDKSKRRLPLQTLEALRDVQVPNVEYGIYYVEASACDLMHDDDQDYTNALSIVLYLRHGNHSLLVPGDVTPDALRTVLKGAKSVQRRYTWFGKAPAGARKDSHCATGTQPVLRDLVAKNGLSVLVTPHHGLESGFCPELFESIEGHKTELNVISEKRHSTDGCGDVDGRYQSRETSTSVEVDVEGRMESRHSVSTRDGQHILLVFRGTGKLRAYLREDPEELLSIT